MVAFSSEMYPYSLDKAVRADCGEYDLDSFLFDLGRDDSGWPVESLEHLTYNLWYHQNNPEVLKPIRKLFILGSWRYTEIECKGIGEGRGRQKGEPNVFTRKEEEWHKAGKMIAKFVALMPQLEELTWISNLPFTAYVWEGLSTSMTKLVLDIGFPVRLQVDSFGAVHKSYITCKELKPLIQQTKLDELRLFCIQDTYQSVIWETVYRNTNEDGMRLLDITMAFPTIVRSPHWHEANDVDGLTVSSKETGEKEYKGISGKGLLHYPFGTGEYLDNFCMCKARIAAKLEKSTPLPLQYLKLDGFVVDNLPFEEQLKNIELLTCGEKCVDAGLRAPKTNNALSHCMIVWPKWQGLFDASGNQRDECVAAVPGNEAVSTRATEFLSAAGIPLPESDDEGDDGEDTHEEDTDDEDTDHQDFSRIGPIVPSEDQEEEGAGSESGDSEYFSLTDE